MVCCWSISLVIGTGVGLFWSVGLSLGAVLELLSAAGLVCVCVDLPAGVCLVSCAWTLYVRHGSVWGIGFHTTLSIFVCYTCKLSFVDGSAGFYCLFFVKECF